MRLALSAVPVPPAQLSMIQRDYYFYLFAARIKTVLRHLDARDFARFRLLEPVHLGLLTLIAHLEEHGHSCSYFAPLWSGSSDTREESLRDKIIEQVEDFDLVGFSPITASWPAALRMAQAIKRARPETLLAIGGAHAWARDHEILSETVFDFVVRKEGEATTQELLEALEGGRPLESVAGLSFRRQGRVVRNPDRPRLDRSLLPGPNYGHLEDNLSLAELAPEQEVLLPIARVTPSTGCSNRCLWCADFWKKEVTFQNLSRFQDEVRYLMNHKGSRYFYLGTHDFFHDPEQALRMAWAMKELAPEMHWEAQTRATSAITRAALQQLAKADCRCLHLGIESGQQELLDAMGKNIVLNEARRVCELAREEGIHTHTYWIVGVPFETRQSAQTTIDTMCRWLREDISSSSEVNLLVGYPGTPFYENPRQYDITWQDPDYSNYDGRSRPTFATSALTTRDSEYLFQRALDCYCAEMAAKIGSQASIMEELGERLPNFDPAVMEAAF